MYDMVDKTLDLDSVTYSSDGEYNLDRSASSDIEEGAQACRFGKTNC